MEEGDIQSMAHHMTELIQDPALAVRLGGCAREYVCNRFSLEESVAPLWYIIKGMLAQTRV